MNRNDRPACRLRPGMDDPVMLRSQAIVAANLAAKSRDPEVAKLLLIVSEQMEEEACELEVKRGPFPPL